MSKDALTLVDLSLIIARETNNAYMVRESLSQEGVWLPKSQVEVHVERVSKGYRYATVVVPTWLAQEKGLI